MKNLIKVFGNLDLGDPEDDKFVVPANMQMSEIDEKAPSEKKLGVNNSHKKQMLS